MRFLAILPVEMHEIAQAIGKRARTSPDLDGEEWLANFELLKSEDTRAPLLSGRSGAGGRARVDGILLDQLQPLNRSGVCAESLVVVGDKERDVRR